MNSLPLATRRSSWVGPNGFFFAFLNTNMSLFLCFLVQLLKEESWSVADIFRVTQCFTEEQHHASLNMFIYMFVYPHTCTFLLSALLLHDEALFFTAAPVPLCHHAPSIYLFLRIVLDPIIALHLPRSPPFHAFLVLPLSCIHFYLPICFPASLPHFVFLYFLLCWCSRLHSSCIWR